MLLLPLPAAAHVTIAGGSQQLPSNEARHCHPLAQGAHVMWWCRWRRWRRPDLLTAGWVQGIHSFSLRRTRIESLLPCLARCETVRTVKAGGRRRQDAMPWPPLLLLLLIISGTAPLGAEVRFARLRRPAPSPYRCSGSLQVLGNGITWQARMATHAVLRRHCGGRRRCATPPKKRLPTHTLQGQASEPAPLRPSQVYYAGSAAIAPSAAVVAPPLQGATPASAASEQECVVQCSGTPGCSYAWWCSQQVGGAMGDEFATATPARASCRTLVLHPMRCAGRMCGWPGRDAALPVVQPAGSQLHNAAARGQRPRRAGHNR